MPSFLPARLVAVALALAVSAWSGATIALDAGEMFADPRQEQRAREIGRQLRCLVCQNQSIFDSNASLAKDLRVLVRERMAAGDTDAEVVDYVASRYGDYVRLRPPIAAHTYLLWLAPLVAVLGGLALVVSYHRGRSSEAAAGRLSADERADARRILKGEAR